MATGGSTAALLSLTKSVEARLVMLVAAWTVRSTYWTLRLTTRDLLKMHPGRAPYAPSPIRDDLPQTLMDSALELSSTNKR
jgi:hypothetical protein